MVGLLECVRIRMRFAGIVGGLMVVDSIAELSLAKHVSKRFARRAGEE